MVRYSRLGFEEREQISRLLVLGSSIREIGRNLGRNASTISREIGRFRLGSLGYRAIAGQRKAIKRAKSRREGKRKLFFNPTLHREVLKKLRLFWSPQQVDQFLKRQYESKEMHVSAETIYTYVYVLPRGELKKELISCLRRGHKKRRKQGHSQQGQSSNLQDMLSIEERPREVADRIIPGHWEGDILIGGTRKQSALGTLVERTTRTVILVPLKSKKALDVRKAFAREAKKLPAQMRLSLTYDQGREMAQHKLFTKETKMQVYFAHPRSPWERGTNENTNGLIRQFFPKGTDFSEIPRKEIKHVQHLLNGRPRKTLDWATPYEAMEALLR